MNIPRFWASAEERAEVNGDEVPFRAWGWSNESRSAAQALARQRLARLIERVRSGADFPHGYAYGDRPPREEILREIPGAGGEPAAIVTRNSYGARVLNAARALFIDVDVPPPPARGPIAWLLRRPVEDPADAVAERLRAALRGVAGASFRIYRTAAGFRVLATDPPFEPDAPRTRQLLEAAGADPAFVKLCGLQRSFRARLTPKHWRIGLGRPPGGHPRESEEERQAFAAWLAEYERRCAGYAVCRFVEKVGLGRVADEIAPVLAQHDAETRVRDELPLA